LPGRKSIAERALRAIKGLTCARSHLIPGSLWKGSEFVAARNPNAAKICTWLLSALGVLWPLAVLVAYLVVNRGYFIEKIGTFGRFLLGGA